MFLDCKIQDVFCNIITHPHIGYLDSEKSYVSLFIVITIILNSNSIYYI